MPKFDTGLATQDGLGFVGRIYKHLADKVTLTPERSTDNVVQAQTATAVPLVVKRFSSGATADLIQVQDETGAVLSGFSSSGATLGGSIAFTVDPRMLWLGRSIKRALTAADESFAISILSDSTGAYDAGKWVPVFAQLLATAYPAYTVRAYRWNDTAQDFDLPTTLQTGTGGERSVRFLGTGTTLQLADASVTQPTTDFDVAVKLSLDDWTPAADETIVAHFGAAGDRAFRFQVGATTGKLVLNYSADGTTLFTDVSTVSPTVADGAVLWIRATLDVDNGAAGRSVKFYTSPDGTTWTQLGTTVTTGATIAGLFNSTTIWELGGRGSTADLVTGNIYEVQIRNGIPTSFASGVAQGNGPLIAPVYPEQWTLPGTATQTRAGAPTLSIFSSSQSGQNLTYLSDATRIKMLLPDYALRLAFMSTSHNEGGVKDKNFVTSYAAWVAAVKSTAPQATPVVMSQNPRFSPAGNIVDHAQRRDIYATLAAQQGIPFVDVYQAFQDTGAASTYVQADGVHPTTTGGSDGAHVWANHLYSVLFPS